MQLSSARSASRIYRRLVVFERELVETERSADPAGLEFSFLGPDQLDEYEVLRPDQLARAQQRLAAGHRCFATRVEGELAAVRWIAVGGADVEYLGLNLALEPGEVFSFDTFTAPVFRRRGISKASQDRLAEVLRAEGHRRLVRAVLPENRSGFGDALGAGFRPTGRIGYVRLGSWRRELRRRRRRRAAPFGALRLRLLAATVFRHVRIVELRLDAPLPSADSPPALHHRFLMPDEAGVCAELGGTSAGEVASRLARGDRCFGTWLEGGLVSARWLSSG